MRDGSHYTVGLASPFSAFPLCRPPQEGLSGQSCAGARAFALEARCSEKWRTRTVRRSEPIGLTILVRTAHRIAQPCCWRRRPIESPQSVFAPRLVCVARFHRKSLPTD